MGPTPAWGCFHAGRQARRDKAQGGRAQGGRPGDRPRDALRGHCQAVGEDAHPRSRCLWAERLRPVLLRRRPDRAHGPGVRENPLSTEPGAAPPDAAATLPDHSPIETCVPNLGIGVSFQDTLRPFLEREPDAYDYLEVVPDTLWTDRGPGAMPRYLEDQDALAFVRTVRSVKPVIPHSIGLSTRSRRGGPGCGSHGTATTWRSRAPRARLGLARSAWA